MKLNSTKLNEKRLEEERLEKEKDASLNELEKSVKVRKPKRYKLNDKTDSLSKLDKYNYFREKVEEKRRDKDKVRRTYTIKRGDMDFDSITPEYIELFTAFRNLEEKKVTGRYRRSIEKYVDYLYAKEDLVRLQTQLNMLWDSFDNFEFSNWNEFDALVDSITETDDMCAALEGEIKAFENNKRLNEYINNTIDEELKVLSLRRITEKNPFNKNN